jgi:hypothetical protein
MQSIIGSNTLVYTGWASWFELGTFLSNRAAEEYMVVSLFFLWLLEVTS